MQPFLNTDVKEQVRQATDIVELVGGFIQLRRAGRNYVGLCPWHDDSKPSLQINPERQSYKCWVCDVGGDVFSFLMQMEGLEFREALDALAERAGIELTHHRPKAGQENGPSPTDRKILFAAMAWAEERFHRYLLEAPEAAPARQYLVDRGINAESIETFHIGFVPQAWDWLFKQAMAAGYATQTLEAAGLIVPRTQGDGFYDRFRGRLMFSIRDIRNRPIAFGGRVLPSLAKEGDAKYINSAETPLFTKSAQLYNLDLARNHTGKPSTNREIIVMEGYTDCIMAYQNGVQNVVAVLGTALTDRHIPLLRRYADSIYLVLDGDEAGQKRTNEVLDLFVANQVDLRILALPKDTDPCDFIASQGSDAFRKLLAESVDALEHKIRTVTEGMVAAPNTHQANVAVESILETISRAPRPKQGDASVFLMREQQILGRIAREFQLSETILRTRLRDLRSGGHRYNSPASVETKTGVQKSTTLPFWDQEFFELLLLSKRAGEKLLNVVAMSDLQSEVGQRLFTLCHETNDMHGYVDFDSLMTTADDLALKNLVVTLAEQSQAKVANDVDFRVVDYISNLNKKHATAKAKMQRAVLQEGKGTLDEQSEDSLLEQIFMNARNRQSGNKPTDG